MKSINSINSILIFLVITLSLSCSKNGLNPIEINEISKKWKITNSTTFQSIEFNKSKSFIIIELDQTSQTISQYGTYEIIDDTKINLSGYGTLSNLNLSSDELSFTMEKVSGEIDTYNATIVPKVITSSIQSETLCKTWKLISVDGESVEGTEDEIHVLFSQAGTYFIAKINLGTNFVSQWMWQNENEEVLCYSHDGAPVCEENENEVILIELTENRLVIDENGEISVLEAI